ncbi:MAG: DNA replication/repair protein RecF [Flavobacteriia bacterium]|nr:DNA replication/repair protein RecF [Flavobacteriia bacterium]
MNTAVISNLHLLDFKNYPEANLTFSPKVNVFVGDNGVGKTNVLDAIHYLAVTKSYFNPVDSQNIRHDQPFMVIEGDFESDQGKDHIYCGVKRGQKKTFKKNKKDYERLADHIGEIPLVMISPADRDLILDGSEVRRKFMDGVISQSDKHYLDDLLSYNKALTQRNSLLKYFAKNGVFDSAQLEIYDEQLIERGHRIHERRSAFMEQMKPIMLEAYAMIAGEHEDVSINYSSKLNEMSMGEALKAALQKDRVLQYTSVGIHKDDLSFALKEYPLKKTGSQGQQKTFTIALKLAQFDFLKEITGRKPILLLDDIFDKLDEKRVESIISMVNDHRFGQIFITDTHAERTGGIVKRIAEESKVFSVTSNGEIAPLGE